MNKQPCYTDEQRRQLDFLCRQAKALEQTLPKLRGDARQYAQQMRIYLATVKEIRALRDTVGDAETVDALLQFAPAGDAQ